MRAAIAASLLLITALGAGCDDSDDPAAEPSGTVAETGSTGSAGSDGADGTDGSAATLPVFCDLITAEQIGTAVGAPVTTGTGPFDACEFDQEDPRALSGSLGALDVQASGGGYEAFQYGSKATMDDPSRHDFDGLGDQAFVDIGTVAGGENLQASGGVLVGQIVYSVVLVQGNGMAEDELAAISERLLRLMVDAD